LPFAGQVMGNARQQVRERSRVGVLRGSGASTLRVSAHLRQSVLRDDGLQELRGAVQRVRPGRWVPGDAADGGGHPMACLVAVAGRQAAGGGCHCQPRDVRELVLIEVVEPTLQGIVAAVPKV